MGGARLRILWPAWIPDRGEEVKYRVHRLDLKMTRDQRKLEDFLNNLEGEVVAIIPNVSVWLYWAHRVDFVLIVEKVV